MGVPPRNHYFERISDRIATDPLERVGHGDDAYDWYLGAGGETVLGWPMLAIRAGWFGMGQMHRPKAIGGVVLPTLFGYLIPLTPVFPGFIINTLFYASLWSAPLLMTHVVIPRRRARNGLCPICRYDLVHDLAAGCPECGWRKADR